MFGRRASSLSTEQVFEKLISKSIRMGGVSDHELARLSERGTSVRLRSSQTSKRARRGGGGDIDPEEGGTGADTDKADGDGDDDNTLAESTALGASDFDSAKEVEALVMARTVVRTLGSLVMFTNAVLVLIIVTLSVGLHKNWCADKDAPVTCHAWMQALIALAVIMLCITNLLRHESPINMLLLFAASSAAAFSGGFLLGSKLG